jgi:hypothetical protein
MAELAIIIGNGFDIDLGILSRYTDFIKSNEWNELKKTLGSFPSLDYLSHSLIYHLHNEACRKDKWFDVENEILHFIKKHPVCTEDEIREIESEFSRLKKALREYLIRVSSGYKMDEMKLPCRFMKGMANCHKKIVEINFNYTNPQDFLPTPIAFHPNFYDQTHVHGSLSEEDIVLGCDIENGQSVNRDLSFMYKYNMLNRATHVSRNLLEAKEIIFYGHSVNEMDFCYFRDFLKAASASPKPIRNITFITLNEKSERDIKDNIRNQGISVTDLYNNLESLEFIHTEKMYSNDSKEQQKWDEMLKRISTKDIRSVKRRN